MTKTTAIDKPPTVDSTTANSLDDVIELYLSDSFFLPVDVRKRATELGWSIPKIQVVPGEEFLENLPLLEQQGPIKFEPNYNLVLFAVNVGVSIRKHADGRLYVLAKLWHSSPTKEHHEQE